MNSVFRTFLSFPSRLSHFMHSIKLEPLLYLLLLLNWQNRCVAFSYVILLSILSPPFIDFTFHLLFPNLPVRLPCNGVLLNTCQAEPSPNIFFFHFLSLAFSPILHPVCSPRSPLPVYLSRLVHLPHFFAEFTTGQVINYVVIWAHTMMNWGLTTLPSDCVCTASSRLPLTVSAEEM